MLLLAAIGENLTLIAVGAVVVSGSYLYALSVTASGWSLWNSPTVIRIPFLFAAAAFYGYLVDRTRHEQRIAAEAESAASAKGIFLATVSHELRTPITGILGWAQLLLDTPLSPEQREYAEGVHRLGDSLVSIIGDFLDFTKIEARRIELETTAFTPRAVVEETVELLAGPAQRKGVEVAYRVDPAVPRALRGDPGRLRQVLLNLVGNALKFTAHGEVAVRVAVAGQAAKTVTLRFEVADTGIGISPEQQARIFEPFEQAHRSTTREYGGTGLGLAIAKQRAGPGEQVLVHRTPAAGAFSRGSDRASSPRPSRAARAGDRRQRHQPRLPGGAAARLGPAHRRRVRRPERAAPSARRARGGGPLRPRPARCSHAGRERPPTGPRHPRGAGALSDAGRAADCDRREGPAPAGRGRHARQAGAGNAARGMPGQRGGASHPARHPARQRRIVSTKITASSRIMTAMKKPE